MSASLPEDLRSKIRAARSLEGRPHEQRLVTPSTFAEILHARAASRPTSPYLHYVDDSSDGRAYSTAEFYDWVRRLATMLHLHARIGPGDRVATALHNHDRAIALYFAAWQLGASVVPLNVNEDDKRLAHVLAHSAAKTLCVFDEYAPRLRELAREIKTLRTIISMSSEGAPETRPTMLSNEMRFDTILPATFLPKLAAPLAPNPDAEALVVYTSGTTGVPKGVALSQYNLVADADSIARWHGLHQESRLMCVLPIHHVNGIVVTHLAPLLCGGSTVLNRKFSAKKFFDTCARFRVEVVSVVPTLLQFLLEAAKESGRRDAGGTELRYLICGAGPLTVDLAARFEDRFNIPVCHGYGLSETTCYSCFLPPEKNITPEHKKWMRDFGYPSIGVPLDVNEMAIQNEHGHALNDGEKGEIVARGHNVMLGYHDNLAANEAAFTYGWFRTGDEGFFKTAADGRHYFFITGRYKELIVRGGVKVSPLEVDEALNRIPGVKAAMAVGFENVTYGEEVGAYVVRQENAALSDADVLAACRAAMPAWMCPKVVVFGVSFPVTSTGKYQRNQLKPLFAQYKEAQFR
ncbi:MAG TPA: class I adenylate-forming enzyme family protein [Planctomycetota bacterium]|nr:class I adenylate-forming enzyme family protein [Planctomycetota bacterium]